MTTSINSKAQKTYKYIKALREDDQTKQILEQILMYLENIRNFAYIKLQPRNFSLKSYKLKSARDRITFFTNL